MRCLRLLLPILASLAAAGCEEEEPPVEPALPEGFVFGPEVECASPTTGWNRLSEEGEARGLTRALPDPDVHFGAVGYGRGGAVAVEDLDADGDLDILLGRLGEPPDVYLNDGSGSFEWADLVPTDGEQSVYVGLADLDGDGLPELLRGGGGGVWVQANLGSEGFGPAVAVIEAPEGIPDSLGFTLTLGDVDGDGDLDLVVPRQRGDPELAGPGEEALGAADLVFRNDGDLVFTEVAALISHGEGSTTQVAALTDRDGDGDLDLYIPADLGPPSAFWRNDGDTWTDDAAEIGADLSMAAMGIDTADLNGDRDLDYCMSDVGPPRCLLSTGDGGFYEAGPSLGLEPAQPTGFVQTVGWGFDLADLDCDGHLDALQASGPEAGTANAGITELPDLLWAGTSAGSFEDVTEQAGFGMTEDHYGLATADLDGDGYLDVVLAGPRVPPRLWMNQCGDGAWLLVELEGPAANRDAYGARVEVVVGGQRIVRELLSVRAQAQTPSRLHFGLGSVDAVDELVVRWPDGLISRAEQLPVRRQVTVQHAFAQEGQLGDDDDDDDDTPDGPGPGERWIEGVVLPAGDDPDAPGIEGATVATLEDPERSVETRVGGAYDLIVPEEAEVSVRIDAEGFVSVVSPIQTAWQVELQAGLLHRLFGTGEFGGFFDQVLGGPWDPSLGALWVQVQGEDERPLAGASVVLSPGPELAAAFNTDGVEPGSTQGADPLFLLLGNVAPGPATIEVTDPRGGVCAGRSSFEVLPGLLTQVVHRCSLE